MPYPEVSRSRTESDAAAPAVAAAATALIEARPMLPPSWRALLSRPDAIPASFGATPAVAALAIGTSSGPMPKLVTRDGPRMSTRKVPSGLIRLNQNIPIAPMTPPTISSCRAGNRASSLTAYSEPTTRPRQKGRKARPALSAPIPRTCWR